MSFNNYQMDASKTFKPIPGITAQEVRLLDWAMGLGGEAGEVLDIIKHSVFHDEAFNKMELAKELGDVLWYVSAIATTCCIDLGDIAALNSAKLNHRYLSGAYSAAESANRHAQENKFENTAIYQCLKARINNDSDVPFSVIVIGPDGSGKTTFTTALAERMKMERIKCDYRQDDKPKLAKSYLFNRTNVIYDRFYYPDDLVYSEVKDIQLEEHYKRELRNVLPLMVASNVVIVYLDASVQVLKDRADAWADDYVKVEDLEKIKQVYQRYLGELASAGLPVIELDSGDVLLDSPEYDLFVTNTMEDIKSRAKFFARPDILERREFF